MRKCADKLENVLWIVRTTPKKSTEETPFSWVYGSEAVTLLEIAVASHRVRYFQ